eukprot:scpid52884/ scgid17881/ 
MPRTALFSPKLNTCKPDTKEKIISHATGTRAGGLAIRERCSGQLSCSMTLIHGDGKSILLLSINIWLASYWQLTPIKRALGHSLDIMGSASNYVHCEQIQTVDKSHTVARLVGALLA